MDQIEVGGGLHPDKPRPPGHAALRRFRESKPGANYFLTINLAERELGLESPPLTDATITHWDQLEAEGHWFFRSGIVMPDHLHLLVRLGENTSLDRCTKLLKGRLSSSLRKAGLEWQEGYYDHRLRQADDVGEVFLYIFLNPYRAGLLRETEFWPGYRCCAEDWKWFGPMTKESRPQPEWLR